VKTVGVKLVRNIEEERWVWNLDLVDFVSIHNGKPQNGAKPSKIAKIFAIKSVATQVHNVTFANGTTDMLQFSTNAQNYLISSYAHTTFHRKTTSLKPMVLRRR